MFYVEFFCAIKMVSIHELNNCCGYILVVLMVFAYNIRKNLPQLLNY